jgi:hypothetical protein
LIEPIKKAEKSQPPAEKIVENKRSTHATEEEEIDDVEPGDEDLVEEIFDDEEEEEVGEPRQQVLKNQINNNEGKLNRNFYLIFHASSYNLKDYCGLVVLLDN